MERSGGSNPIVPAEAGHVHRFTSRVLAWLHELRGPATPPQSLVWSGGDETASVVTISTKTVAGALFTNRGVGYADYNEDAAVLGVLPARRSRSGELVFAGAFDQAGGMGKARQVGAASAIAAQRFEEAARRIASEGGPAALALESAVRKAHEDVRALGANAATTFTAGLLVDGTLVVANTGDSSTFHYGPSGRLKNQTLAHNFAEEIARQTGNPNDGLLFSNQVTSAIGGRDPPWVDLYTWRVSPGDAIVFASDGVTDANLLAHKRDVKEGHPWIRHNADVTAERVGELVAHAHTAEEATDAVARYALGNMEAGLGKADNTTVVVLKVK